MSKRPPLLARALLRVVAPPELYTELAGDLEERFHARSEDGSGASLGYWKDVVSPSMLRLRREVRGMPLPPGVSPRSGRGDGPVRSILTDLKFAIRTLSKSPGFTAIATDRKFKGPFVA